MLENDDTCENGVAISRYEKTVGFITTDHSRIGTVQQLQDYVKTIGFEVIAVRDEAAMTRALTYFKEEARVDYILIDTAGKIIVRQKLWKK